MKLQQVIFNMKKVLVDTWETTYESKEYFRRAKKEEVFTLTKCVFEYYYIVDIETARRFINQWEIKEIKPLSQYASCSRDQEHTTKDDAEYIRRENLREKERYGLYTWMPLPDPFYKQRYPRKFTSPPVALEGTTLGIVKCDWSEVIFTNGESIVVREPHKVLYKRWQQHLKGVVPLKEKSEVSS